jgi:hypothetical protein
MAQIIPFTEYRPRPRKTRDISLFAQNDNTNIITYEDKPKYPTPEDDPKCKYNGKFVVADCYCEYPQYYRDHKEKYNLIQEQIDAYDLYCWNKINSFTDDTQCKQITDKSQLNLDCYCKYPDAYKNAIFGLTGEEISRWDAACKRRNAEMNQPKPPEGFGEFAVDKLGDIWDKVSVVITGFFTPEGIEKLEEFIFYWELPKTYIKDGIVECQRMISLLGRAGLEKLLTEMAENAVAEATEIVGEEVISAIAATVVGEAITAIGEALIASTVAATAFLAIPVVGEIIDALLLAVDVLMLAGMVLDLLGERFYGYNNQLNASDLLDISNSFNQVFMQVVMHQVKLQDQSWPFEYFADSLISQIKFEDKMKTNILGLQLFYTAKYLQALPFNSAGEFIYHPTVNQPGQFPLNKNTVRITMDKYQIKNNLEGLSTSLGFLYGNNNSVAVIFLKRNWFVILIIVLVIIIFIVFIK